jgi:hypothetical protein
MVSYLNLGEPNNCKIFGNKKSRGLKRIANVPKPEGGEL